ncbi:hypothetical protein [Flavobacterium sp. WC2509]|uniref:hypothetical protein n=1 Tax=Flavobacterium sp. WC2509 TaxID=3461406 RepID=UPI004044792C
MLESFTINKKCIFLCFFSCILSIGFLQAQEKKTIAAIEKVYLHTDRSTYFIGEDLWYKAYDVRAYNNLLFDNSKVLYVELISSDSNIIARNKTKLEMGLGNGDFKLTDSLGVKPGHYQLRAYTNWNRNFGDDFVFKKDIEIINVYKPSPIPYSSQKNDNTEIINAFTSGKKSLYKVDFFPEGGSLLENVASVVGFKAVDNNGNPIDCKGEVFDSNDELITSFMSSHDGMGKFQFIPIEGKQYYAKIKTLTESEFRTKLPKAIQYGYLLSFRAFKGKNIITINTNSATFAQNSNGVLTVVFKAKGISYLESSLRLKETSLSFELPKDLCPDGINQITLLDSNNKPQSERLIYIDKEHDLEVSLVTDKANYIPQEKVAISVSSKSKAGVAKSASFSLSVTDMNGEEEDKDLGSNICTYFLMESDIRGKINNPAYYFDTANLKRLEDLDNLLLTQGWRDFLWKTAPIIDESRNYQAEKEIIIAGSIKQLFGKKPKINCGVSMTLMNKKGINFYQTYTDSIGRFIFKNVAFTGKSKILLYSRDKKGKAIGKIVLDSIDRASIPISFEKEPIVLLETPKPIVDNVLSKYVAFGVKPENILKEVEITTQKRYDRAALVGLPEFTYFPDARVADQYIDIYQLIQQVIPGTITEFIDGNNTVRFTRYTGFPLFVIDGFTAIDKTQVDFIQPADVLRIEAIRGIEGSLYYGSETGVIGITTNVNKQKKKTFNFIKKEMDGYYAARTFYTPDPEKPNPELDDIAAVNNTIYWNPYVHPDKTGSANVNYYNSKVETKVKVVLEGITGSGIPVVKKTYYTIKNNKI